MNHNGFFSSFLTQVIQNDLGHLFWLRSLSYLEYVGYRKIVKALPFETVRPEVVHHLQDEIGHSLILKQVAQKVFGHLDCSLEALSKIKGISEAYFQSLDQGIKDYLENLEGVYEPYKVYCFVSHIIEMRALDTYRTYMDHLSNSPVKIVIRKILKDEIEHLKYTRKTIVDFGPIPGLAESDLLAMESRLFKNFIKSFQDYLLH